MKEQVSSEIPSIFFSSKTKKPFEWCTMCEVNLLRPESTYLVEKAFSQELTTGKKKLVFEYAICTGCHEKVSKDFSKKSMERLQMYFELYVDFEKRDKLLLSKPEGLRLEDWISNCIISGKSVANLKEFQIAAFFQGKQIRYSGLPFALGYEAADELQNLLSKETKEILEGFKDYVLPPDVRDEIPDDRLILV